MSQPSSPSQHMSGQSSTRIHAVLSEAQHLEKQTQAVVHRPWGSLPAKQNQELKKLVYSLENTTVHTMDSVLDVLKQTTAGSKEAEIAELTKKVARLTDQNALLQSTCDALRDSVSSQSSVIGLEQEIEEQKVKLLAADRKIQSLEDAVRQLHQKHEAEVQHLHAQIASYEARMKQLVINHQSELEFQRSRFVQEAAFQKDIQSVPAPSTSSVDNLARTLELAAQEFMANLKRVETTSFAPTPKITDERIQETLALFKDATDEANRAKHTFEESAKALQDVTKELNELVRSNAAELTRLAALQPLNFYPPQPSKTSTGILKGQHQARR